MEVVTPEIITPEEFAERMKEIYRVWYEEKDDIEALHDIMDKLMMNTLELLGYTEGVKIFDEAPKWYS